MNDFYEVEELSFCHWKYSKLGHLWYESHFQERFLKTPITHNKSKHGK